MQTDFDPRPLPTDGLEAGLARRFELHLAEAQRDYPRLQWQVGQVPRMSPARRRLALAGAAIVLVVAALAGSQLPVWRGSAPAASHPASSTPAPSASDVTMGTDGIPTAIGGERVYRPADVVNGSVTGTFLVGGDVLAGAPSCTPPPGPGCHLYVMGLASAGSTIAVRGVAIDPTNHVVVVRASIARACPPDNARGGICQPEVLVTAVVWATPTGARDVVLGSDGIPVSIDGAHVYRPEDVERGTATGTFLVGGRVEMAYPSCQPFAGGCDPYFGLFQGVSHIAIKGLPLQPSWESAVVRGTIDPSCPPTNRGGQCFPGVIAQSVVWSQPKTTPPLIGDRLPQAINGEPVFRPSDGSAWQALGGSFLLAGIAVDRVHPTAACPTGVGPYPMYPPENRAEARLLPVSAAGLCDGRNLRQLSLDGTTLDLAQSPASLPDGHLVVVRVHTHDPAAAECSAEYRTECGQALVVEAVVWDLGPFVALGSDGVPTAVGVDTVYRAANLPASGTILLGGRLERPKWGCIAPVGKNCGPWTIDGLVVTDGTEDAQAFGGTIVVARVVVRAAASSGSVPTVSFIEIVWHEGGSSTAPPGS